MTATANLFFGGVMIGQQEAPQRILESQRFQSTYDAVLKKRFGRIMADDFLKYARRFTTLCNEIYQGSVLELRKDKSIPLGFAVFAASQGVYEGNPGEKIDASQFTTDAFHETFMRASSMVLDIRPKISREDIRSSFAQIAWTHGRPRTILFYAQHGGRYDLKGSQRPLENLLFRKMFYVTGAAPSFNFAVKLGVGAYIDEVEGRLP